MTMASDPATRASRADIVERLVDAIHLPIGRWDRDARLVFCNAPYLAWSGRRGLQLLGRTLEQLYGAEAWAAARDAFAAAFTGATVSYERLLTHLDGEPRWCRVQVFPEFDGDGKVAAVYTVAFDIHDFVTAQQALEAARARLSQFAENIPYPITYVDRECRIIFANRAYVAAVGINAAQLLGRHLGEVRGEHRWRQHRPYFERALAGEPAEFTRLVQLPGQEPRWMRTSYVPDRGAEGEVLGVYTILVDVHDLKTRQQQLERSVERDPVTDVLSRRAMIDRIEAALTDRRAGPVALFFVDLDGFKTVNDMLGHRDGDLVLARVAQALSSAVRAEDSVGRFGGDEFLVLARVPDREAAMAVAQQLVGAVRASAADPPALAQVTASVGYAMAPDDADTALKLVQRADDAMYFAKRSGKNRPADCSTVPI
jgi:diguanylate cyclase (GGDEF)-like protein/PAS domain S-box-containing protein